MKVVRQMAGYSNPTSLGGMLQLTMTPDGHSNVPAIVREAF